MINLNNENINNIKNSYLSLNKTQRAVFVDNISSGLRKKFLDIIKKSNINEISKKTFEKVEINITNASKFKSNNNITSINQNSSVVNFFNTTSIFGYMTSENLQSLIEVELYPTILKQTRPSISKETLNDLLILERKNIEIGEKINLARLLKVNGYSLTIKSQEFDETNSFNNIDVKNVSFYKCKFNWVVLSDSSLRNVSFINCDIRNVSFMKSKLEKCNFEACDIKETMFTASKLKEVKFSACDLICSSFEDALISNCNFKNVNMPSTHFLEAKINKSSIFNCELTDTIFFGTDDQFEIDKSSSDTMHLTRPVTVMLVNAEKKGVSLPKAYLKLDSNANLIPLRISMHAQKAKKSNVNKEVDAALKEILEEKEKNQPIPQLLLKKLANNLNSESIKILKKAEKLASEVDSFFLPGGEDIPPALYGQAADPTNDWGGDYHRSILELAIIHQAFNKGIPLMGVCRGFQLSNVYCGAQLIQDIEGQKGIQKYNLSFSDKEGIYGNVLKNNIISTAYHHQGILLENSATENLETSIIYDGFIKASEQKHAGAVPMILLQFHPEFFNAETSTTLADSALDLFLNVAMSKENDEFWIILAESAKVYQAKKKVLNQIKNRS